MSILFISDLHLEASSPKITSAFQQFIQEKGSQAEALYILGDLFDVWLGDDNDSAFNTDIIRLLAGCPADKYIMHGNRDFLLGSQFCLQAGVTLLGDPTLLTLYDQNLLLMHGDSLCTRDEAYMAARDQLRNPEFIEAFLKRPLKDRQQFAADARNQSKTHTSETAMDIMDVTQEEVVRVMAETRVNTLIHGHTHRPSVHELDIEGRPATRIVLGDWRPDCWYAELNQDGLELKFWS